MSRIPAGIYVGVTRRNMEHGVFPPESTSVNVFILTLLIVCLHSNLKDLTISTPWIPPKRLDGYI